jgi:hypothetical protein
VKTRIIAAIILSSITAVAQVGVSPLKAEFGKKASAQMTVSNGSLSPIAVTLEAKTLTMGSDGHLTLSDLDPAVVKVKLHETSARLAAKSSRTFDYDIKCNRCAVVISAAAAPIQKLKVDGDAMGARVVLRYGMTNFVCPSVKGCRESFLREWGKSDSK